MKKIVHLIIISLLIASCSEDFLDRTNPNELSDQVFWGSLKDAEMAIMGCYDGLQSYFDCDPWSWGILRTDHMSDNGYLDWGSWMPGGAVARGRVSPVYNWGNAHGVIWEKSYSVIGRTNRVIANVPQMAEDGLIDQADADRIVAEARFIRAMVYLYMTVTIRDVPLVKTPLTIEEANLGKTQKDEIVSFIISDVENSYQDLPQATSGGDWPRASQGAALALLARINLWHGNYGEAASYAQQVIDMGQYALYPSYDDLFRPENEQNEEVVFAVSFIRGPEDRGFQYHGSWGTNPPAAVSALSNLANDFYCTDGLPIDESPLYDPVDLNANRDPRLHTTVIVQGDTWRGDSLTEPPLGGKTSVEPRKFVEEWNNENHFDKDQDFYVIRYAHVLLMRAEALAQQDQNPGEVIQLINQIRDRVGMPHVQGNPNGSDLLDIVKHERRVETAFEGLRWFDIRRWGIFKERAYDYYMEVEAPTYGLADRQWSDKLMVWPIPQNELDVVEALEQHDEWK